MVDSLFGIDQLSYVTEEPSFLNAVDLDYQGRPEKRRGKKEEGAY